VVDQGIKTVNTGHINNATKELVCSVLGLN